MITEVDIRQADGRILHAYDTRASRTAVSEVSGSPTAVFWLHGSPNIGSPPEPLFAAAEANGLRWVSYDRPGYGGSTPQDGRTVASVAVDVAALPSRRPRNRPAGRRSPRPRPAARRRCPADRNGHRGAAGTRLGGAAVTLVDTGGRICDTTLTSADGSYEFLDLAVGQYTVTATNWPPSTHPVAVADDLPSRWTYTWVPRLRHAPLR